MCEHGNEILLEVSIPDELSHMGKSRWKIVGIDSCIAPLVRSLNNAGIYTASCCCGHGKELGHIWLQDGRVLVITPSLPFGKDESNDFINKLVKTCS